MYKKLLKLVILFSCISFFISYESNFVFAANNKKVVTKNTSKNNKKPKAKMVVKPKQQSKNNSITSNTSKTPNTNTLNKSNTVKIDKLNLSDINIDDIVEPSADYKFSLANSSPFDPPNLLEEDKGIKSNFVKPNSDSVLNVDLSSIKIKGIWLLDNGERRALVQGKSEQAKIVEVGSKISDGKVVSIKEDSIVVGLHVLKNDGIREYQEKVIYFKK